MKTKSKNAVIICVGAVLITALIIGMIYANNQYRKDNDIASRMVGYGVGASKKLTNGKVTYLSLKNNAATLSFTNETGKEWEPELKIQGFKQISETLTPLEEGWLCKGDIYTLTNKEQDYQSDFLLYDALKFSVDGQENSSCVIPPDGKEHIVEIDYSYLNENDIDLNSELYIDGDCFVIRPSNAAYDN